MQLIKLLKAFDISNQRNEKQHKNKCYDLKTLYHPFFLFMHCATVYNILILGRTPIAMYDKSRYSSIINSILSFTVWHMVRARSEALHSSLRECSYDSINDDKESRKTFRRQKMFFAAIFSTCAIIPVLLAFHLTITINLEKGHYTELLFIGHRFCQPLWAAKTAVFILTFTYISQQILFPSVFLMFYCIAALNLAESLNIFKNSMELNNSTCSRKLSVQSQDHKQLLVQIKKHDEIFSFPVFLLMCLTIIIGFTGMALEMKRLNAAPDYTPFTHLEAISYIYFYIVAVSSVTYTSSRIPAQQIDIRELYQNAYESEIEGIPKSFTMNELRVILLKMIYERKIIHLTAWNIIKFDKNFAFTIFGAMLSYGFLILQLR